MGGKGQKFPNIGWPVKLQSFIKVMRHILNSILALRGSQCSSISEEVVVTLGGRLNISLAALFKTD